jgi:hypothetical protein
MVDPDAEAIEAIRSTLGCSHEQANDVLTDLVNRGVIECRSEGGTFPSMAQLAE